MDDGWKVGWKEDILGPWSTIKRSLQDSSWQDHLILGWVVIRIYSRRGHAPPAKRELCHQNEAVHRGQMVLWLLSQVDYRSVWRAWELQSKPPQCLIGDGDQLSGETPVARERLGMAAVFRWVSMTGMCSQRNVPPPLREEVRSDSLVPVGSFPQLVCSHSGREVVVLHHILEVKFWLHLKLKKRSEENHMNRFSEARTSAVHIYLHHWTLCPALWHSWWIRGIPPCCKWRLPVKSQSPRL